MLPKKRATGWSCKSVRQVPSSRSSSVGNTFALAAFHHRRKSCPGWGADGWGGGSWTVQVCPRSVAFGVLASPWLAGRTRRFIFTESCNQRDWGNDFSTQNSLEKKKSLLSVFKNRINHGTLTFEKTCLSITSWCFRSRSEPVVCSFVGFGAAEDIRWDSCQTPTLSQRWMLYKLACFQKPCWEPHHAFVPVLLIITYGFDAYHDADDMQDKEQGFLKVLKCRIFHKDLNYLTT